MSMARPVSLRCKPLASCAVRGRLIRPRMAGRGAEYDVRSASSQANSDISDADLLDRMKSWSAALRKRPSIVREEQLSPTLALQAMRTLPTRTGSSALSPPDSSLTDPADLEGFSLPPGWSLFAFQPLDALDELGPDGSSKAYSAPSPFSRRMWAGGKFEWPSSAQGGETSKIGERVQETVSVASVDLKLDRGLVFVHQDRVWHKASGDGQTSSTTHPLLKERRSFVFRPGMAQGEGPGRLSGAATRKADDNPDLRKSPSLSVTYTPTLPLLFRFSALTFNAHRIHYDAEWCREVEGHEAPVVHGPMTACLMAELGAHWAHKQDGKTLRSLDYRATSPMYIDKLIEFRLIAGDGGKENEAAILAIQEGKIGMRSSITFD